MIATHHRKRSWQVLSNRNARAAVAARRFLSCLPRSAKRFIMLALDLLLLSFASCAAIATQPEWVDIPTSGIVITVAVALLVAMPVFVKLGLYRAIIRYVEIRMMKTVLVSVSLAVLLLASALHVLSVRTLSPQSTLVYWLLSLLFIGGSRVLAREYFRHPDRQRKPALPVAIYGAGDAGAQLAIALNNANSLNPVAFVDDRADMAGLSLHGITVHASAELPRIVKDLGVRKVLLAMPSASKKVRREVFDRLQNLPVKVRTVPAIRALLEGRAKISDIEDLGIEDLVGREPAMAIPKLLAGSIRGKSVLVTGAGGSIGSELCRQILSLRPKKLVLVDISEFALYSINQKMIAENEKRRYGAEIVSVLASIAAKNRVRRILSEHGIETFYHAAAYKHVPLVEMNAVEGIRNNVIGTMRAAEAAIAESVELFVLISSDKAVRPTNIMGASKRMSELIMQALGAESDTRFCMVRFGNVLDSSGSVVPLFRRQIHQGGPVTVTHPDITRYFMTIPEAAQLVLQAGTMAKGGDVFVLDMGSPVKIVDLARRMIRLSGLRVRDRENPHGDIEIKFTGLRPGEKLFEELLIGDNVSGTEHPSIMRAVEETIPWSTLKQLLNSLQDACIRFDEREALSILSSAVPQFRQTAQTARGLEVIDGKTGQRSYPLKLVRQEKPPIFNTP